MLVVEEKVAVANFDSSLFEQYYSGVCEFACNRNCWGAPARDHS